MGLGSGVWGAGNTLFLLFPCNNPTPPSATWNCCGSRTGLLGIRFTEQEIQMHCKEVSAEEVGKTIWSILIHLQVNSSGPWNPHCGQCVPWTPVTYDPEGKLSDRGNGLVWMLRQIKKLNPCVPKSYLCHTSIRNPSRLPTEQILNSDAEKREAPICLKKIVLFFVCLFNTRVQSAILFYCT